MSLFDSLLFTFCESTVDFYIFVGMRLTWNILYIQLVAQKVKSLLAMQETQVWSLGWEEPLEKEMETHSSILA